MSDIELYRRALQRIGNYDASRKTGGRDEWAEAAAFHEVQRIARETLEPQVKAERIRAQSAERDLALSKIRALKKNERYFCADFTESSSGVWVRFLKGDPDRAYQGIVRVKILERVGRPGMMTSFVQGSEVSMHVSNLRPSP